MVIEARSHLRELVSVVATIQVPIRRANLYFISSHTLPLLVDLAVQRLLLGARTVRFDQVGVGKRTSRRTLRAIKEPSMLEYDSCSEN